MSLTFRQKINALTGIMLIYGLVFLGRAVYWLHDRNAAIPAFLDTPVDLMVIGLAYIYKWHLIRAQRGQVFIGSQQGSKPQRTPSDYLALIIGVAIVSFIVLGIVAFIAFGVFTSGCCIFNKK